MKALKTLLVGALLSFAGNAMGQSTLTLTAEDVVIGAGETAELILSMENSFEMAAWSVTLYLPQGIKLAYDEEEEEYCIELSSRHKKKHSVDVTYPTADGGYLINVAAGTSVPPVITGNEGEVATLTLEADPTFTGTATGKISKIQGSTQDAVQTNQEGDVEFSIKEKTATGINSVNMDAQNGKIYNLNGQRVEKAQNGIYIQNGKKVVVK